MAVSISTKLRACAELIRMDLALGAGCFIVAGEIFTVGGWPPADLVLFGFLTLFFISGSANISNDYFDREVDRINLPSRPLPSGRITIAESWALYLVFTVAGLASAAVLGPLVVVVIVLWGISLLYNMKLKEYGFFGNVIVAACLGMMFITGAIAAGTINGIVLIFAALAFFFDLGEEIASDVMDAKGDQMRSSESVVKRWGRDRAMTAAGLMYGVFFVLSLLPFLMGWLGYDYLFLVAIMDLVMIYCTVSLLRSQIIEEGRLRIRQLYLSWGIFVIVFAATRIL